MNVPVRTWFDVVHPGMPPAIVVQAPLRITPPRARVLRKLCAGGWFAWSELLAAGDGRSCAESVWRPLLEGGLIERDFSGPRILFRITLKGRVALASAETRA